MGGNDDDDGHPCAGKKRFFLGRSEEINYQEHTEESCSEAGKESDPLLQVRSWIGQPIGHEAYCAMGPGQPKMKSPGETSIMCGCN